MPRKRSILFAALALTCALIGGDVLWVSLTPDWKTLESGKVPKSRFMMDWEEKENRHARWSPVPYDSIPKPVVDAIVDAEDSAFWDHHGFDWEAYRDAAGEDLERGRLAFGGSTITQQTAKNLFLTPSRSPVRKWHEALLTVGLEHHLSKRRILEIYLNDVELGPGLYGVEAAAEEYWHASVFSLGREEGLELAATLPSPRHDNPASNTKRFQHRLKLIRERVTRDLDTASPTPAVTEPQPVGLDDDDDNGQPAVSTTAGSASR